MNGVEGGKDSCYQWKEKASVRKETNAVSMRVTIVPKNQNTLPPHLPSNPCHEVEVCRRKVSKAKVTMVPFFDNRADTLLKGTCTRTSCEYWDPLECQVFNKNEKGCEAGDKCLFPHHKVDEPPNKKPKKGNYSTKEENAMTRMLWIL